MKKSLLAACLTLAITPAVSQADVVIKLGGGLKAQDTVKEIKFQTGGRLQWDYNNASLNDVTDESDFAVRRARLFVKSQVGNWAVKSQFNIAEESEADVIDTVGAVADDPATPGIDESVANSAILTDTTSVRNDAGGTVEDLYIQYKGWGKKAKLTIGRQKAELGLEELESSKDISFLERNAATERFSLGRQAGIQLQGDQGNLHYAIGLFEDGDNAGEEAAKLATVARAAYAFKSDNALLHVGGSVADRRNDIITASFELAGTLGAAHFQAEYFNADPDEGEDINAAYVQVGYVLTGEVRPYKGGKFKRIKPANSHGAFEVVARYTEGDGNYSDTELGNRDASEYGIGVNWYAHNNVRLGLTYSESEAEVGNDEGEEFRARAQFVF